ncbi:MAG: hypothetical protein AAB019_07165, partial [Planctomycetota bacterium]
ELIGYIKKCGNSLKPRPFDSRLKGRDKRIFVVHGDDEQTKPLVQQLNDFGYQAHLPERNEEVVIG